MPEPRCVWERIVPFSEIPFHCCHSLEALGSFFLYSGFDFLEQNSGVEPLHGLSGVIQAENEGGK